MTETHVRSKIGVQKNLQALSTFTVLQGIQVLWHGENLFLRLRESDPEFPLNQDKYSGGEILVADDNFIADSAILIAKFLFHQERSIIKMPAYCYTANRSGNIPCDCLEFI